MRHADYEGYEIDGRNVQNVTDAFRLFPEVGLRPFTTRRIGRLDSRGRFILDSQGWYPLGPWLEAFAEIGRVVGASKMFEIGKRIPENSPFPPGIDDIHVAMKSVDVAYHLNHRKNGVVMFDPATGTMLEGIGHYRYQSQPGAREIVLECENPYPCDMDRGLLTALARRFHPNAMFDHRNEAVCRKRDSASCTYAVRW